MAGAVCAAGVLAMVGGGTATAGPSRDLRAAATAAYAAIAAEERSPSPANLAALLTYVAPACRAAVERVELQAEAALPPDPAARFTINSISEHGDTATLEVSDDRGPAKDPWVRIGGQWFLSCS
jgi:hypothetical protein